MNSVLEKVKHAALSLNQFLFMFYLLRNLVNNLALVNKGFLSFFKRIYNFFMFSFIFIPHQ